jgi:hypothetical protein
VYVVGVDGRSCVLINEKRCLEFCSFYAHTDVMHAYVFDARGHVLSCVGGLFFLAFCGGSPIVFLFAVLC